MRVKISDVTLDSPGISEILTGPAVTKMVHEVAENVARQVETFIPSGSSYFRDTRRGKVDVIFYTAGGGKLIGKRSAALVTLNFIRGAAVEARYQPLKKAVAAQGLRIRKNRG